MLARLLAAAALAALLPLGAGAQDHVHIPGMQHPGDSATSAAAGLSAGQAAYAALAEVVRVLEADPATDWSRVNLEALRQHLIDMDEVTLRATVQQTNVPGGAQFLVTGEGRTRDAIRRMAGAHGRALVDEQAVAVRTETVPNGVRMTVTAQAGADARAVARIRGLGFIGILVTGDHHGPHHLAMARGAAAH